MKLIRLLLIKQFIQTQKREKYYYNLMIKLQSVLERIDIFRENIKFMCSLQMHFNFSENKIDKFEEMILNLLKFHFGDKNMFFVGANPNGTINIKQIISNLDLEGIKFMNFYELNELEKIDHKLKGQFVTVTDIINQFYLDSNEG
jgi:hypothetical protein